MIQSFLSIPSTDRTIDANRELIEQAPDFDDDDFIDPSNVIDQGVVLRRTFTFYGIWLIIFLLIFCWVRKRYPRPFTIRQWSPAPVPNLRSPLADDQFGFISWVWMLNTISDDELIEHCGLDALCFCRTLSMGYKLCLLGVFNASWLIPLYRTAADSSETEGVRGPIVAVTLAHVPPQSSRLVGTALAAYMLFGYTMYLILHEFDWFIG